MMKKPLAFMMALILIVGLTACAAPTETTESQSTSASEEANTDTQSEASSDEDITLTFWEAGANPTQKEYFDEAVERYTTANPNVTIEYSQVAMEDTEAKLTAAYASNLSPDIMDDGILTIVGRADRGMYEPLNQYIDTMEDKDDIVDYVFDITKYNEESYGVAYYPNPVLWAYRTDFVEEVGLDATRTTLTWDEMREMAIATTVKNGDQFERYGWALPAPSFTILVPFAHMNGGAVYDEDSNPVWNTTEWVETLDYLSGVVLDDGVCEVIATEADFGAVHPLASGKATISNIGNVSLYAQMIADDPSLKDKLQFFFPASNDGVESAWCGAKILFMSSQSQNKDAAWDVIEFFMQPDEMQERYSKVGAAITRHSMTEEYIADNPAANEAVWKAIEVGVAAPMVPWASSFLFTHLPNTGQQVFYEVASSQDALDENMANLVQEIADMQ